MSFRTVVAGGSFGSISHIPKPNPQLMRRYIVLLFGSICFILATACSSRPAPPPVKPVAMEYFYRERQYALADAPADAPTREQVHVTQVATPNTGVKVPRPRFYQRWRRVHGRRYHFTYRVGDKRAMVIEPTQGQRNKNYG